MGEGGGQNALVVTDMHKHVGALRIVATART